MHTRRHSYISVLRIFLKFLLFFFWFKQQLPEITKYNVFPEVFYINCPLHVNINEFIGYTQCIQYSYNFL